MVRFRVIEVLGVCSATGQLYIETEAARDGRHDDMGELSGCHREPVAIAGNYLVPV